MKAPLLHLGCNVVDLLGKGMHLIRSVVHAKRNANRSVCILLWHSYRPEHMRKNSSHRITCRPRRYF